ncbi:endolytic transglycosylase MltG [Microbacterium sp. MPKO10]|uniref:endolytic transglycosylase MltG n=1 Tax=Microbacterium sp. MPKO10 TaxID=2989818 RepID=UPI0022359663|nr:endolytic transglycosylase MltG [Microbacterium sp. MPKO10]MCW4459553.1 endolytic transglycosylase MltG [Microbacterium sp. MPKO10]
MPTDPTSGDDPLRHLFNDEPDPEARPLTRRERRTRRAAEQGDSGSPASTDEPVDADASPADDTAPASSAAAAELAADSEPGAEQGATGPQAGTASHPAGDDGDAVASPDPITSSFDLLVSQSVTEDRTERRRRAKEARTTGRTKKRSGIILWTILPIVVVAAIVASGFYVWNTFEPQIRSVMGWEESNDYEGSGTGEVLIVISEGDTGTDIAATLKDEGVTKTSEVFYQLLLTQNPEPTFQPGTYSLKKKMSAQAALSALQDPDNKVERTALIQEGLSGETILTRLSDATEIPVDDLRKAASDPTDFGIPDSAPSIEGWLFPAVYEFEPDTSAHDVIQRLVDRMMQALDEANVAPENREKVLTEASIIQREARQKDDFYKVSRVIQNRLEAGMKLQMDSTAQYGVDNGSDSVWSSKEALESDSPWNTYKHKGLPIGPIASPGDLAIDAAVNPADGDWLYFVTVNLSTGETVFSTTNEDHEKAVKQLRTWCEENPGNGC